MTIEDTDAGNAAGTDVSDASQTSTGIQAEQPAPSLDESLRAKFQTLRQDGAEGEQEAEQAGRIRGPDGKFLPKADKPSGQAQVAEAAAPGQAVDPPQQVQPKPHDSLPSTWKKGNPVADSWATLPDNVREEIHRREGDFLKGIGQYKEAATFGADMAKELLPYQQVLQETNTNPRDAIKSMALAWNTLIKGSSQDKANLVLQLVKDYSIDFSSLGTDPQQGTAQQTQVDPRVAALERELGEIKGSLTAQERQRAEAETSANLALIQKFGSDPAREHYGLVESDIIDLLKSGLGQGMDKLERLQMAYDKAIWMNQDSRKLLLAKQEKERADKSAKDAADARRAAGANVTRRGTPPVAPKTGSIEDSLRRRFRELNGA